MSKWECIEEGLTYRFTIGETGLFVYMYRREEEQGALSRLRVPLWEVELVVAAGDNVKDSYAIIISREIVGDLEGAQGCALDVMSCWFHAIGYLVNEALCWKTFMLAEDEE